MTNAYTRITHALIVGSLDPQNALLQELITVAGKNVVDVTRPIEVTSEQQNQLKQAFEKAVIVLRDVKNGAPTPDMSEEAIKQRAEQCEEIASEFKELGLAFKKEVINLGTVEEKNESSVSAFNAKVSDVSTTLRDVSGARISKIKAYIASQGIDVAGHAPFEKALDAAIRANTLENKLLNKLVQDAVPGAPKLDIKPILEETKPAAIIERTKPLVKTQTQKQAELMAEIRKLSEGTRQLGTDVQKEIGKLAKLSPQAAKITVMSPGVR